MSRTASSLAFIGRARLIEKCRVALDAGLDIWLTGEAGVGKTALAKRIAPGAIYCPHVTPAKELLAGILVECWRRGWWMPDEPCEDDEAVLHLIARLDIRARTEAAAKALKNGGSDVVLVLDDFDGATPLVMRACRRLAESCTVIACSVSGKPTQRPFLTQFTHIEVPRLTRAESELLVARLLADHAVAERERARLVRQLVEQGQGLPFVLRELVKRGAARGDLSARGVNQEGLHGHKTIDLTPLLIVICILGMGARIATRGLGDQDLSILFGFSGAFLLLVRLFAGKLSGPNRR